MVKWKLAAIFGIISMLMLITGLLLLVRNATHEMGVLVLHTVAFLAFYLVREINSIFPMGTGVMIFFYITFSVLSILFWGSVGWLIGAVIDKVSQQGDKE